MRQLWTLVAAVVALTAFNPTPADAAGKALAITLSPATQSVNERVAVPLCLNKSGGSGKILPAKVTTSDGYVGNIMPGTCFSIPTHEVTANLHVTVKAVASTGATATAAYDVIDVAPPPPPSTVTWTKCADEWGQCSIIGTANVRYGVPGSYVTKTVTDSTACDNTAFGSDPAFSIGKTCETDGRLNVSLPSAPTPAPSPTPTWTYCAGEGQDCTISGPANVRYGVTLYGTDYYITKAVASPLTIHCGGLDIWGSDPMQGVPKSCYTDGTPVAAAVDPNCLKPMTWQGVKACTEILSEAPPKEEPAVDDGLPRDSSTIEAIIGGGASAQAVPDDIVGAERFFGTVTHYSYDDPLLKRGLPGAAHLHAFFCNDSTDAFSDYISLRTHGKSTCSKLNRSAIWTPALIDIVLGVVDPYDFMYYYYKRIPAGSPGCRDPVKRRGICINLPNGQRWVWGYDMVKMAGGLTDPNSFDYWLQGFYCTSDDPAIKAKITANGHYRTLTELADAGCPIGAKINIVFFGPDCSDGNFDSADHRSHVSYATGPDLGYGRQCVAPYKYLMPEMQFNFQVTVIGDVHNLRYSSDIDMENKGMRLPPGGTLHVDYWEANAADSKGTWEQYCIDGQRSCANGDMGNGFKVVGGERPANDVVAPFPVPPRP